MRVLRSLKVIEGESMSLEDRNSVTASITDLD